MRKSALFIGLLLALAGGAGAKPSRVADGATLFARGGSAYEAGKYAEALDLYTRALAEEGLTSGLAYNMGNAEFRLGRRGLAAVWYERARGVSPRDGDILFNLRVARSHLQDEDGAVWEYLDRVLAPWELPWAVALLAWIVSGLAGLSLWGRVSWHRVRAVVVSGAVLLVVASAWFVLRERAAAEPWAVVIVPVAEARSGPGDNNPVGFTVPEGRRALVTGFRPGWMEIGVPSLGLKGWVRAETVERITMPEAVK
jgi:tetratricopeptide (TPR) repeat protein